MTRPALRALTRTEIPFFAALGRTDRLTRTTGLKARLGARLKA